MNGWGDVVAAATQAAGIKPCGGCKKRQAWMNENIPFPTALASASPVISAKAGQEFSVALVGNIAGGSIPKGLQYDGGVLHGTPMQPGVSRLVMVENGKRRTVVIEVA